MIRFTFDIVSPKMTQPMVRNPLLVVLMLTVLEIGNPSSGNYHLTQSSLLEVRILEYLWLQCFFMINILVCIDNLEGYMDYKCIEYDYYCERKGDWYSNFRAACKKTCKMCKGKKF